MESSVWDLRQQFQQVDDVADMLTRCRQLGLFPCHKRIACAKHQTHRRLHQKDRAIAERDREIARLKDSLDEMATAMRELAEKTIEWVGMPAGDAQKMRDLVEGTIEKDDDL